MSVHDRVRRRWLVVKSVAMGILPALLAGAGAAAEGGSPTRFAIAALLAWPATSSAAALLAWIVVWRGWVVSPYRLALDRVIGHESNRDGQHEVFEAQLRAFDAELGFLDPWPTGTPPSRWLVASPIAIALAARLAAVALL